MPEYREYISSISDFGMERLIALSKSNIPESSRNTPWRNLNHGVSLLSTDLELWSYIAAYGEMHAIKCRSALQNFPFEELLSTEIIDWGCGQGIATMCLLEMLKEREKLSYVRKITLIEPSPVALQRAKANVRKIVGSEVEVVTVNKYLPGKDVSTQSIDSLEVGYSKTVHLFSNILDIPTINLRKLAEMISSCGNEHYVVCMGPTNYGKARIDEFCNYFHPDHYFSDIESFSYAYTSDTHKSVTCKTKAFKFASRNFSIASVENKSETLSLGSQYTIYDEYNMSPEQNRAIPERIRNVYTTISKVLKPENSIFICPSIGTDSADLIIMRPRSGIAVINVCDDTPDSIVENRNSKKTPFDVISTLKEDLITTHIEGLNDACLKDKTSWWLVKTIVCFPNHSRKQVLDTLNASLNNATKKFIKNTAILGSDMLSEDGITRLFSEIYFTYNNPRFTPQLYESCTQFFAPEWHTYKEGRTDIILDTRQKELAKSRAGAKQKIRGVAGCGKTQIMVERAVNAQIRTGKTVLILTFNITLINYILSRIEEVRKDFSWKKFEVINYHQFFNSQANKFGLKMTKLSSDNEQFFDGVVDKLRRYSAIFIDEVQDYDSRWLKLIYNDFLEVDGEFVVFGDEKQNIFNRPLDAENKVIVPGIAGRWNELKQPHRIEDSPIINLTIDFQKEFLSMLEPDDIEPNLFPESGTIQYKEFKPSEMHLVEQYCEQLVKDGQLDLCTSVVLASQYMPLQRLEYFCRVVNKRETQITSERKEEYQELLEKYPLIEDYTGCREDYRFTQKINNIRTSRKRHFTMKATGLKFSSIHSYKGWEAESVVLLIDHVDRNDELIYTAITRAKKNLYVINLGNLKYKQFFETRVTG